MVVDVWRHYEGGRESDDKLLEKIFGCGKAMPKQRRKGFLKSKDTTYTCANAYTLL